MNEWRIMDARRGYVPDDEKNFSPQALKVLKRASRNICYLLNEGYGLKQASTFVGNHFLLSERQRLAIARSVASREQVKERLLKKKELSDLSGQTVWIDGFNQIITLEVLFSGSPLFSCMDGAIRDLAALRGTYKVIPETETAVRSMLEVLSGAGVQKAVILLDEPVSNSGRLKMVIADLAQEYPPETDIRILKDVDRQLYEKDFVITSDSVILDHCRSWFCLTKECLPISEDRPLQVW